MDRLKNLKGKIRTDKRLSELKEFIERTGKPNFKNEINSFVTSLLFYCTYSRNVSKS